MAGIDIDALNNWASDPDITHVSIAPDSSELEQLFADLAANISVPGATDIVINEVINPDFIITGTPTASVGTISMLTGTSFRWNISQLGSTSTESATVRFTIKHNATTSGIKNIDQSISYTDNEGNTASFANPSVFVDCQSVVPVDLCSTPIDIPLTGCNEFIQFDAGNLELNDTGRILQLDVNLLNVCPDRARCFSGHFDRIRSKQRNSAPWYENLCHSAARIANLFRCACFMHTVHSAGRGLWTLFRTCCQSSVCSKLY